MTRNHTADAPPTAEAVETLEVSTPFEGYFRIDRYRLKHRLYEGGWTNVLTRDVFEQGHASAVVLYDPKADELVFVEQFRQFVHHGAAELLGIDDGDGATVVARDVVADADGHQLDR